MLCSTIEHLASESLSRAQQRDPWLARALRLVLLASPNRPARGAHKRSPADTSRPGSWKRTRTGCSRRQLEKCHLAGSSLRLGNMEGSLLLQPLVTQEASPAGLPALKPDDPGPGELRVCSPYLWHFNLPDDEVHLLRTGACLGILETVRLPEATAAIHRIHAVPVRTCRGGSSMHRHPKASSVQLVMHSSQTHLLGRPAPAPSSSLAGDCLLEV